MHFVLFYDFVDDYLERRAAFRDEHLGRAWASHERGELVLAGALTDPANGALLVFSGDSPEVAESFAKTDPYVLNGVVKHWKVREWATVAGALATNPVHPAAVKSK
jgi:uncharacterized protein